jgi:hypothetical protein
MVERWGYSAFDAFYRDIPHPEARQSDASVIDATLQDHFGLDLDQLEDDFQDRLAGFPYLPDLGEDVDLMVAFFDTVRRYQQQHDPNAYFLNAWLLNIAELQKNDITADYVRHPQLAANIALETLLIAARTDYEAGRFPEARLSLSAANAVLDAIDTGVDAPFGAHSLAADHYGVVTALLEAGYQPDSITIRDGVAYVTASRALDAPPEQLALFLYGPSGWRLE